VAPEEVIGTMVAAWSVLQVYVMFIQTVVRIFRSLEGVVEQEIGYERAMVAIITYIKKLILASPVVY
jgi:hypothetical protein